MYTLCIATTHTYELTAMAPKGDSRGEALIGRPLLSRKLNRGISALSSWDPYKFELSSQIMGDELSGTSTQQGTPIPSYET